MAGPPKLAQGCVWTKELEKWYPDPDQERDISFWIV